MNLDRAQQRHWFARAIAPYLSLEGLILAVTLAWALRILLPDCNMCGKPEYRLVLEIFRYENVVGALLLVAALAKIYSVERPAARFADEAHALFCVLCFFLWPLVGLSLLWANPTSLGTLTYLIFGLATLAVFLIGPTRER